MSKELIERLLDNRVTGFNLTVAAVEAAECIERLEQQLTAALAAIKSKDAAIKNLLPWVVTQIIACNGLKCREAVCISCTEESEAEANAQTACDKYADAKEALAVQLGDMKDVILCHAEPRAWNETITGRLATSDDHHRSRFPMCYEPLYRAWEPK